MSTATSNASTARTRAEVVADMSVSLDGFVADPFDGVEKVFAWYAKPQPATQPAEASGGEAAVGIGAIIYGRRTFDVARGWDGNHPTGAPVIVVTHSVPDGWPREDSTVSFATGGVEAAMEQARQTAGTKVIALGSPSVICQCLDLGLVDRIQVKLVPLLLGDGIRLFSHLESVPIELESPAVTEGNGVTHLHYRVA
jgi:dihydrofolate reductase